MQGSSRATELATREHQRALDARAEQEPPWFEYLHRKAWAWVKANPSLVFLAAYTAIRAMGATVKTGNTGLFFHLGRATRELEPGFYFKVPYFQQIKVLPTRSRTMDVPDQKVTSGDGLVWFVDVNLVYRIVDVRKGLIEVDDLIGGMKQMLGLSVQEIVRRSERSAMRLAGGLDQALKQSMAARLGPWGVELESVGFTSIRPSPKTLLFTQLQHASEERLRTLERLEQAGLERGHALAMLGSAPMPRRRAWRATRREALGRRRRRILRAVEVAGKQSGLALTGNLRSHLRRAASAQLGPALDQ